MSKLIKSACLALTLVFFVSFVGYSQSSTATLTGTVEDEKGAVIPGANVTVVNNGTGARRNTTTNQSGAFTFSLLPPSAYTVTFEHTGFGPVQFPDVVLNVGDQKALQVQLKVGDVNAQIEVRPDASLVRTDGSVGTVVDRQFVENIPLNGRSFQSLITLTPGVVLVPSNAVSGQFSVNGQRPGANVFIVDGVSANIGTAPPPAILGAQIGGNLPGLTVSGTTQSLVSVDALQEFAIQTSSYAAEYGRQPGGQISISTRSGTNQFHGSLFNYFRNEAFDANDWFSNRSGRTRPPMRQNDFGGTFGGPMFLPRFGDSGPSWYNGRDRTFLFVSYEGLRLRLPAFTSTAVPSLCLRGIGTNCTIAPAAPALRPILNAFPLPNGGDFVIPSNQPNAGQPNGFAEFALSYSNQSTVDATSLRIDHRVNDQLSIFGRVNVAPSSSETRSSVVLSTKSVADVSTTAVTIGSTALLTSHFSNEFKINFSNNRYEMDVLFDPLAGAIAVDRSVLIPSQHGSESVAFVQAFFSNFPGNPTTPILNVTQPTFSKQRQLNLVDSVSYHAGDHQLKFGIDFRQLTPVTHLGGSLSWRFTSLQQLQNGIAGTGSFTVRRDAKPIYYNFSAFGQDTWSVSPRLTVTLGLRWEVNPAPTAEDDFSPIAVDQTDDFATMRVRPPGAALYKTTYGNFGPRLGLAYQLSTKTGRETVIRGGFGMYYDTGNENASLAYSASPFIGTNTFTNVRFPLNAQAITVPSLPNRANLPTPYPSPLQLMDPNLKLPVTFQWNVAVEKSLGADQSLTVSYVGAAGRRLLQSTLVNVNSVNPLFTFINVTRNNGTSDYDALQATFQRRLARGLQAQASYTWAHAIDEDSAANTSRAIARGNATFDIRHVFASAFTYEIPVRSFGRLPDILFRHWSLDARIQAQSEPPVDLIATSIFEPSTGEFVAIRPNVVPGVPLYVEDQNMPGGRRINRDAFQVPSVGQSGNLGRNQVRGLPAWQLDLALRKDIRLSEKLKLQLRAEAFNVLNHPNFGTIQTSLNANNFGEATNMMNRQLGGLNQLYQLGGPRSMQFSARLSF